MSEFQQLTNRDDFPGPIERRWTERLYRRVFGRWSPRVVAERIAWEDERERDRLIYSEVLFKRLTAQEQMYETHLRLVRESLERQGWL